MIEYSLCKNYFVRQAVLPTSDTKQNPLLNNGKTISIEGICNNPVFRQAILCASESLYESMNDYLAGKIMKPKRKKQIEESICEYWMRMSTRATPFGLFSSVSIGTTKKLENKKSFFVNIDADSEWILSFSKIIERKNIDVLSFISNDLIYDNGHYYRLPYSLDDNGKSTVFIEKDFITAFIVEACKDSVKSYKELIKEANDLYPNTDIGVIKDKIMWLLSNDFLVSHLRPNLHKQHLLKTFYDELKKKKIESELVLRLEYILSEINYVSEHIFEEKTEGILLRVISDMRQIHNSVHVLKFDLINNEETSVLDNNDVANLEEFANFLVSSLTHSKKRFTIYDEYKDAFLNEYGDYKLIQLNTLLDSKVGLGVPCTFKEFQGKRKGQRLYLCDASSNIKYYFLEKYRQAIQNGSAIYIDDLLERFGANTSNGEYPTSFDLILKIVMNGNNKTFVCNKDIGCIGATRTMGRFSSNWKQVENILKQIAPSSTNNEDYIVCDLVYFPNRFHLGNVATGSKLNQYSLSFYQYETKYNIPISDVYVMIEDDRFILYSKKYGKKLKVKTNNLLYHFGDSPEIRFIKEIQLDGIIRWEQDIFENLLCFDYMPEIKYKSIILRPETWVIVPPIQFEKFNDFDEWFVKKYEFLKEKRVAILYADNELLVNVNNLCCRQLIFKQYLREKVVMLVTAYNNLEYATEVALPFVRKDKVVTSQEKNTSQYIGEKNQEQYVEDEELTLGIENITVKIYGCREPEEYMRNQLKELVDLLVLDGTIDTFYFLYYSDPMHHIRIRFFKYNTFLNTEKIIKCFNEHVCHKFINSFELTSYVRESERYGGFSGMLAAERIFCVESQCVMYHLSHFSDEVKEKIYVLYSLDYLKMWGWDKEEQLQWLDTQIDYKKDRNEWQKERKNYYKLYFSSGSEYLPKGLYESRIVAINNYIANISSEKNKQEQILGSLLHMSFNRFFGMNRKKEQRLLTYARNLLYEIYMRNKNK